MLVLLVLLVLLFGTYRRCVQCEHFFTVLRMQKYGCVD
jgi:hypothetical protein